MAVMGSLVTTSTDSTITDSRYRWVKLFKIIYSIDSTITDSRDRWVKLFKIIYSIDSTITDSRDRLSETNFLE